MDPSDRRDDTRKKLLNQAIFDKFLIENEPDGDVRVEAKLKAPFDQILEPIREDIAMINRAKQNASDHLSEYIEIAKRRIRDFFGCGLDFEQNKSSYSTNSNFFESESSSKNFLVEAGGVEPPSENTSSGTSPGADGPLHSLAMTQAVMLHGSVASFVMPGAKLTPVTCTTQITPKPGSWSFRGGRPH